MPARNVYIALIFIFASLFIAFKTSVKDQVLRGVASQLRKDAFYPVSSERLLEGALAGMTDAVGDNFTKYIPPAEKTEYMHEIQGQFAGVGLAHFVKDGATGEFYFVPLRGAPAAEAGLKFGDRIVEVDGKSVKDMSLFKLANAIRGEEQTTVKLKIRPRASISAFADAAQTPESAETADSATAANTENTENTENAANVAQSSSTAQTPESADVLRDVELTRVVVQQDVVYGDRLDENGDWIYTLKDRPEIGYVAIDQFADATTPQTLAALDSLEKAGVSSVILDFRGNPGGFLPDAVAICDEFVKVDEPIVEVRDRNNERVFRGTDRPKKAFRVVVLVDGDSASAAEIVSAALQDSGVAAVGGARSYGKGTVQSLFELPFDLGMLRVTTAQFYRPSGKPIRRIDGEDAWGVDPDAALAVDLTPSERFYRRWLRAVRISGSESAVDDARIFAFATAETDALLRRAAQKENAFARLEALAELGVDSETASELFQPENSASAPALEAFVPSGRAPYFDPQLDRAVDYLLGTLDADAPQDAETPNPEESEKSEADAPSDAAE